MTITQATLTIEQYFADNYTYVEVDYLSPSFTPVGTQWLQLSIAPVISNIISVNNCSEEYFDIHLVGYGGNKVEASSAVDEAIALIRTKNIDDIRVKTWRTNASGVEESGTYFHKVIMECVSRN